ncbi:hypothetical protein HMPREF9151_02540 [Hoylesella saccharolytica F0055]|uniref:Uncharacterized protein n=1 Tax=Hoylesella saccharolytica F0055 TaxID=1127699 RepID=L1MXV4_9BACT|nr:hypothetical protein HMPREF9151_02540 [Hoylesella saccharolytica F0055]
MGKENTEVVNGQQAPRLFNSRWNISYQISAVNKRQASWLFNKRFAIELAV